MAKILSFPAYSGTLAGNLIGAELVSAPLSRWPLGTDASSGADKGFNAAYIID